MHILASRFAFVVVCSAFIAAASPAIAAPAAADPTADAMVAKILKHLDTDKDGRISRAEAAGRQALSTHFDRIDTDHDGFLSRDELILAVEARLAKKKASSDF
jgi:Ca2+-binding EF-hand superfamily protein